MTGPWGILFDMDGVLVDSYLAHFQSWQDVGAPDGVTITEEQFVRTFGRTSREIIADLWPTRPTDARVRELDQAKEARYREILAENFPLMDGALELITALHEAGARLAIGSSGPPENVQLILDKLGCAEKFSAVVTGKDVQRGKPEPDVFLLAAERLSLSPLRCAVVEDAPPGVAAANAAGAVSVGFVSTGHQPEDLAAANYRIFSLRELSPEKLRGWIDAASARKSSS